MAYRQRTPVPEYPTLDLVAAGIMAYHANDDKIERADLNAGGGQWEGDEWFPNSAPIVSNKTLATKIIRDNAVTDDARAEAAEMVQALQTDMTFKLLTGKTVSPFVKDMVGTFDNETSTEFKLGLLIYVPNTYAGLKAAEKRLEEEVAERYTSKAIGSVGQKVTVNFTLISKRWIDKFACFSAFGKDDAGNLISFFTGHEDRCVTGKLTGKVKFAGQDKYHGNAIVSNLNFVKVAQ